MAFFPKLLAGPIERASHFLRQLTPRPKRPTAADLAEGMSLFVVGLFKKVALADYLALYVDKVYAAPDAFDGLTLALATFAFGWKIYFDFSGYTDMARGVAQAFGFDLVLNFNNPYLATGLGDFWNRWHISLSSWFKDYLYIPLGGNRRGTLRHLPQHAADHGDLRAVARGRLDLRHLGLPARAGPLRHPGAGADPVSTATACPTFVQADAGVRLRVPSLDLLPGHDLAPRRS